jgi:hypothetical protein
VQTFHQGRTNSEAETMVWPFSSSTNTTKTDPKKTKQDPHQHSHNTTKTDPHHNTAGHDITNTTQHGHQQQGHHKVQGDHGYHKNTTIPADLKDPNALRQGTGVSDNPHAAFQPNAANFNPFTGTVPANVQNDAYMYPAYNNYLDVVKDADHTHKLIADTADRMNSRGDDKRWTNDETFQAQLSSNEHSVYCFDPVDTQFFIGCHHQHESRLFPEGIPGNQVDQDNPESQWRRLSDCCEAPYVFPDFDPTLTHYGRVRQGGLQNFYFVEALNAIACRPKLAKQLFLRIDISRAIYIARFYKNGLWVKVEIDDFVPCDSEGRCICCSSEHYPYILWPSLVEKAYAKLHTRRGGYDQKEGIYTYYKGGWEALGEGGDPAEAMTDLTGGVGGRFFTGDVSPDRLFIYFYELQRDCIFVARVNVMMCEKRGVRLKPYCPYIVNRAAEHEGRCYVQLFCAHQWLEDGGLQEVVPYELIHNEDYPESTVDGFCWMNINDFHAYFETVYECRLVNSGDVQLPGMPPMRLGGRISETFTAPHQNVREPWFEYVFAFPQAIRAENLPEINIAIETHACPCEVICCLSQTDNRQNMDAPGRRPQEPVLLKVYEKYDPSRRNVFIGQICKSEWKYARDSMVAFKATRPGHYTIVAELPRTGYCHRLIFRCYTSRLIGEPAVHRCDRRHELVEPPDRRYPGALKWTFVGCTLPENLKSRDAPATEDMFETPCYREGMGIPNVWDKSHEDIQKFNEAKAKCVVM